MRIYGCSEEALLWWALRYRLPYILGRLSDESTPDRCQVFFQPFLGSGGEYGTGFGQFDFVLLSQKCVYPGVIASHRTAELPENGRLRLRDDQLVRHEILRCYLRALTFGAPLDWNALALKAAPMLQMLRIQKSLPSLGDLLDSHVRMMLETIHGYYPTQAPCVKDLLLYFHDGTALKPPQGATDNFEFVALNYSVYLQGGAIRLDLELL